MIGYATPAECASCGHPMRPATGAAEPGLRPHNARGLCPNCYRRARLAGRLGDWPGVARDHDPARCPFCADVAWLASFGVSGRDLADRLGTTPQALRKRLWRHGHPERGDPT